MAACALPGHPDLYGLGIRLAFYLQWFALALLPSVSVPDALNMTFLHTFTVAATIAGLVFHLGSLQPVEIYILLLLLSTAPLYFLVPVYLWRAATACNPRRAMERADSVRHAMGPVFKTALGLAAAVVVGLSLWFWSSSTAAVHNNNNNNTTSDEDDVDNECETPEWGFFFGQIHLASPALITINILLDIAILAVGLFRLAAWIGLLDDVHWYRRRKHAIAKHSSSHRSSSSAPLQMLRALTDVITATLLVMAVELVVAWNRIAGVNRLDSAAQLIPPVLSGAYLLGSVWVRMTQGGGNGGDDDDDDDDDERRGAFFIESPYWGGAGNQQQHEYVYTTFDGRTGEVIDNTDWPAGGRRSRQYQYTRRKHRRRRSSRLDPNGAYGQYPGMAAYPEMTAANGMYAGAGGGFNGPQVPPEAA